MSAPTTLDRMWAAFRLLVRAELHELGYLGMYTYVVRGSTMGYVDAEPASQTLGLPSVTRAPNRASATAMACPCFPLLRLAMTRTASMGSRVPPAETTTCCPAHGPANTRLRSRTLTCVSGPCCFISLIREIVCSAYAFQSTTLAGPQNGKCHVQIFRRVALEIMP